MRRKISAPLSDFQKELKQLCKFDNENQENFGSGLLSKKQLHLLTESIFFASFRSYEGFIKDIFLLYCQEKSTRSNAKVKSYLKPRSFTHAEELIQSSMTFLDWTNPDKIIARSDIYLRDGFPVKIPYSSAKSTLDDLRKIRNHIAHRSKESVRQYKRVVQKHFTTDPLLIPQPGEFLLLQSQQDRTEHYLLYYLNFLAQLANDLT